MNKLQDIYIYIYIFAPYNDTFTVLNNEGALIDVYSPLAPYFQPTVYNKGTILIILKITMA